MLCFTLVLLRRIIQFRLAFSILFGVIQRLVCQLEQIAVFPAICRHFHRANRDSQRETDLVSHDRLRADLISFIDALCVPLQVFGILHVLQKYREFVSADASAFVVSPEAYLQHPGKHHQHLVTDIVTIDVIHILEVIQIQYAKQAVLFIAQPFHP